MIALVFGRTRARRSAAAEAWANPPQQRASLAPPVVWIAGSRWTAERMRATERHRGRFGPEVHTWRSVLHDLPEGVEGDRAWLRGRRAVVLEAPRWASPEETARLVAMVRAWSGAGARVALLLPTGTDRGGAEIASLLWEPTSGAELRAHRSTAALRGALFEAFVATGEAVVLYAGSGAPRILEPWSEPTPAPPTDLADRLFSGPHVQAPPADRVRIWRCADPEDEARAAAWAVREAIESGADPTDVAIATADSTAIPTLTRALDDLGIAHTARPGPPLSVFPVAAALQRIASLAADGLAPNELCSLAADVSLPLAVDARTLRRWCLAARVPRGQPRTWAERLDPWLIRRRADPAVLANVHRALAQLEEVVPILSSLHPDATPREWTERLFAAASALGLPGADAGVERLRAWAACLEVVDRLAVELSAADPGRRSAGHLAAALRDALSRHRVASRTLLGPGVAVVPLDALAHVIPPHVIVIGLTRGEDAIEIVAAVLAEALDGPGRTVTLSRPASRDGAAVAPSSVFRMLGVPDVSPPLTIPPAIDPADRARAELEHAARTGPLGAHDGIVSRPPPVPRAIAVTAFETWVRCPARYWYEHLLRLEPEEPWSPELDPRRRGIAVHRILERMVGPRAPHPSDEGDGRAERERLHAIAVSVLDEIEAEGAFDPAFQAWARDRLLAGLLDDRPAGLLRAWLDDEQTVTLPLRVEAVERAFDGLKVGPTTLRGVLDRVDVLPDGTRLVTDYKTGRAPGRSAIESGLALQTLAYLAATAVEGHPVASVFRAVGRADALRRSGWAGDPEALDRLCPPAERRDAVVLDATARAEQIERLAGEAADLAAGRFTPTHYAPEIAGCPTCPYRSICRLDPTRHGSEVTPRLPS